MDWYLVMINKNYRLKRMDWSILEDGFWMETKKTRKNRIGSLKGGKIKICGFEKHMKDTKTVCIKRDALNKKTK